MTSVSKDKIQGLHCKTLILEITIRPFILNDMYEWLNIIKFQLSSIFHTLDNKTNKY